MDEARGPLPAALSPAAWLLARAYGVGVAWRNARFDGGAGIRRLEVAGVRVPVVSVGNLTAGGTGKSPFVAWCAARIVESGGIPVIALRGYRAGADGRSDEAEEYARTAPGARIVVGARRREALAAELSAPTAASWRSRAVVLLDDGFQHRRIARDLDVVLVDATRPGLDGDLLPNGWLREPARNLARASLVVLTKACDRALRESATRLVERARGRGPDAACDHAWNALEVVAAAPARSEERGGARPVSYLRGREVVSACALGNPAHFHRMVERAGAQVAARLGKPDHRAFALGELERAAAAAGVRTVVTSRKDAVKLVGLPSRHVDLVVPELAISFLEGEEVVRAALAGARTRAGLVSG